MASVQRGLPFWVGGKEDSATCPGLPLLGMYLQAKLASSPVMERVLPRALSHASYPKIGE